MAISTATKKKYFPDETGQKSSLFSGFDTGIENEPIGGLVTKNIEGMLTGESYTPYKTQARETFARAAQNLRTTSGQQNAAALGQGTATKAQGGVEQKIFQGLTDAELGIAAEEQAMKERGITQAAAIGEAEQDIQTQRRGQDIGLTQSREAIASQEKLAAMDTASREKIAAMNITSTEKLAAQSAALDTARLEETARQFNISTEQTAKQFNEMLKLDYEQLSVADKQFLATLGLDKAKFEASKEQFQAQLEQEGRLTMAELGVEEKRIAEGARQFDNRLEFDEYAFDEGLNENERNRVWQALENEKAATNAKEIAFMQNDTERWKVEQTAILTRAGWDVQTTEAMLDRRLKETLQANDNALQWEIEQGRITLEESRLIQQASQFDSELAWQQKAKELDLTEAEAERIWRTNERISNNAFIAAESSLQRQLEKEIEGGRIAVQEAQMLQQASQFKDEMDWMKEAKILDISEADAQRLWQSSENAKSAVLQKEMQQIQNEFSAKGWNWDAMMASIDTLDAVHQADILSQLAVSAGLTYQKTDADGNSVIDPETGQPIIVPGLRTYEDTYTSGTNEILDKYFDDGKTLTAKDISNIKANLSSLQEEGIAITENTIEKIDVVAWTTGNGRDRWDVTTNALTWVEENKGKVYEASNGRLYEVYGVVRANPKDRNSMGSIQFRDLQNGTLVSLNNRTGKFPGGE